MIATIEKKKFYIYSMASKTLIIPDYKITPVQDNHWEKFQYLHSFLG